MRGGKIAELYDKGLHSISGLTCPAPGLPDISASGICHVYHQYTIRTSKRDELQAYLKDKGISTMVYYPFPLHEMKVFKGRSVIPGSLENSEKACAEVLSLPIEPLQKEDDTERIIQGIREFFA